MSDDFAAEVARGLANVADAVVADLEEAGITADATRGLALSYRQSYLELRSFPRGDA